MIATTHAEYIFKNTTIGGLEPKFNILNILLNFDSVKAVVVYAFLLYIGFTLFKFLYGKNNEDKILQKIIGGLGVFIVAILSNSAYVFFTSLFIGGLIIASEDFMMFLAAIIKTQGDKIAETVGALKAEKATKNEVVDKISNEILEISKTEEPKRKESDTNENHNIRLRKIKSIEELLHPKLTELLGEGYETHMKLTSGTSTIIVDGIIRHNNKIKQIVEIKYISEASFVNLKYLIHNFKSKLAKLGIKKWVILVVVSDKITLKDAEKMADENRGLATLLFFKFTGEDVEQITLD